MKKFLLSFAAFLSLGMVVSAAESEIASIAFTKNSELYNNVSSYTSTWKAANSTWAFTAFNNNNRGWDFIACGRSGNASTASVATAVAYDAPISKIVFSIGDRLNTAGLTSVKLQVADNADFTDPTETTLTAPEEKSKDWVVAIPTPESNMYYKVIFECNADLKSNGQTVSLTKIALYSNTDKKSAEYAFSESSVTAELGTAFVAPEFTKAADAPAPVYASSNEDVATVDANSGAVTLVGLGTTVISATSETNSQFLAGSASYTINVIEIGAFTKAASISTGKYVLSIENSICIPIAKSYSYGYLYYEAADFSGDEVKTNVANAIDIEYAEGKFTMKDCYGRYLGMDAEHFTSFQLYTEVNEGCYWTAEFEEDGTVKMVNALNTDCFVCKTTYNNLAPVKTATTFTLPTIYVAKQSGVAEIVVDENAPVEFYNLQGVRVENPENGLYIRRQGNKAEKVVIK